jgi:glycosyltransferase involved in cell wall biosynthesis
MKVIFFNRFFFPDESATAQIVSDLAFHLAAKGHEVHAVTSRNGPGQSPLETIRGLTIHRVATALAEPHSLARRGMAYLDYYVGARKAARRLVAPNDVVIVKTDPPLLSAAVGHLAKRRGARVVVWLQDVFPEVAHEYGIPGMGGWGGAVLRRIRDSSLVIADRVVVIGDRMAQRIAKTGVPAERLEVIHNWADGTAIKPIAHEGNPLRREWGLDGVFVVGYSGNLGRVHEFDTMLGAASLLRDDPGIRFLIVGRGPRHAEVRVRVSHDALDNVRFEPHQDRELLAQSLGAADVQLSVLRPEFEGLVHPSKLYGIMASGRPTIFVGDPAGETAQILAASQAGLSVRSGDAKGLAAAIISLREGDMERKRMGMAARRAFDARFSMSIALEKWRKVVSSLCKEKARK